jgi:hypothetical protein
MTRSALHSYRATRDWPDTPSVCDRQAAGRARVVESSPETDPAPSSMLDLPLALPQSNVVNQGASEFGFSVFADTAQRAFGPWTRSQHCQGFACCCSRLAQTHRVVALLFTDGH